MDINVTIFIQIINFLVAYVIIRNLLLKPTVAVILQEESHQTELHQTLSNLETANKEKEETLACEWESCRQEFKKHAPNVIDNKQTLDKMKIEGGTEVPSIDKKSITNITDQVANQLTERLSHVR